MGDRLGDRLGDRRNIGRPIEQYGDFRDADRAPRAYEDEGRFMSQDNGDRDRDWDGYGSRQEQGRGRMARQGMMDMFEQYLREKGLQ